MNHLSVTLSAIFLGVAAIAAPTTSEAATNRISYVGATNACDATDPANFTGLRFRTIGVYNASGASIQIACSVPALLNADNGTSEVSLFLHNFRATDVTINCTVSAGSRFYGVNNYPQGGTVAANTSIQRDYSSIDRVSTAYTHYNVTCILPPNTELSTIRVSENSVSDSL